MNKTIYSLDVEKELQELNEIREEIKKNKESPITALNRKKINKIELDEIFSELK